MWGCVLVRIRGNPFASAITCFFLSFRLRQFDRRNWRTSYKALILLEHLVTRGPKSVADEFDCDVDVIAEMGNFQYVDEKG